MTIDVGIEKGETVDIRNSNSFPPVSEKLRHALIRPHGSCSIVKSKCESDICERKILYEYAN